MFFQTRESSDYFEIWGDHGPPEIPSLGSESRRAAAEMEEIWGNDGLPDSHLTRESREIWGASSEIPKRKCPASSSQPAKRRQQHERAPPHLAMAEEIHPYLRSADFPPLEDMFLQQTPDQSAQEMAEQFRRTREAATGPQTRKVYEDRNRDLEASAKANESRAKARSTLDNYETALRWWRKFVEHVALPGEFLYFDHLDHQARRHVENVGRRFLQFTHVGTVPMRIYLHRALATHYPRL